MKELSYHDFLRLFFFSINLLSQLELLIIVWFCVIISDHYHIFVGDLDPEIENEGLYKAFSAFGQVS